MFKKVNATPFSFDISNHVLYNRRNVHFFTGTLTFHWYEQNMYLKIMPGYIRTKSMVFWSGVILKFGR